MGGQRSTRGSSSSDRPVDSSCQCQESIYSDERNSAKVLSTAFLTCAEFLTVHVWHQVLPQFAVEMRLIGANELFEIPLTRPTDTLSPSDGETDGLGAFVSF